jgi:uncharacterized protein YsxB (DUF464 family)
MTTDIIFDNEIAPAIYTGGKDELPSGAEVVCASADEIANGTVPV